MRIILFVVLALLLVWLFTAATGVAGGRSLPAAMSLGLVDGTSMGSTSAPGTTGNEDPFLKDFPKQLSVLSVLFALCGAIGATLHALGSLVAYAGNGRFNDSWNLWYLAQPLRGATLAAGFFWLLQGGLLSGLDRSTTSVNGVAMMGTTFLVGLFSDPAIEKLREVFQVLFKTADKPRGNASAARVPNLTGAVAAMTPTPLLKLTGTQFAAGDRLFNGGTEIPITAMTETQIVASLPATIAAGDGLQLSVRPSDAAAQASAPLAVTVMP